MHKQSTHSVTSTLKQNRRSYIIEQAAAQGQYMTAMSQTLPSSTITSSHGNRETNRENSYSSIPKSESWKTLRPESAAAAEAEEMEKIENQNEIYYNLQNNTFEKRNIEPEDLTSNLKEQTMSVPLPPAKNIGKLGGANVRLRNERGVANGL